MWGCGLKATMFACLFVCLFVSPLGLARNAYSTPTCRLLAQASKYFAFPCSLQGQIQQLHWVLHKGSHQYMSCKEASGALKKGSKKKKPWPAAPLTLKGGIKSILGQIWWWKGPKRHSQSQTRRPRRKWMKWRKNSGGTKTGRRVARAGMNGGKTGNRNGKSGEEGGGERGVCSPRHPSQVEEQKWPHKGKGQEEMDGGKSKGSGQDEKNVNLVSCLGQQQDAKDSQQAAGQADPKGNCRSC